MSASSSDAGGGSVRILLDPTSERAPGQRARLPRLESLDGKTVGLLDISKPRGDLFLDHPRSAPAQSRRRGAALP